jgi:hypothetical protein
VEIAASSEQRDLLLGPYHERGAGAGVPQRL